MTSSHLFSGCRLIRLQQCCYDLRSAYRLLSSPEEGTWAITVLERDVTSGPDIRDHFVAAVESADLCAKLKAASISNMLREIKVGTRFEESTSSSQTQPYTPPPPSYDRSNHKRVWEALGEWSGETLLTKEEFYFAFGQELNTVYDHRVTDWNPEDDEAPYVLKMRRWARVAIALKLIEARLSKDPDQEVAALEK